jgi:hypothetical protein
MRELLPCTGLVCGQDWEVSMDWQQIASLAVVAITAGILARRLFSKGIRPQTPCGHPCVYAAIGEGSAKQNSLNVDPQSDILVHRSD